MKNKFENPHIVRPIDIAEQLSTRELGRLVVSSPDLNICLKIIKVNPGSANLLLF